MISQSRMSDYIQDFHQNYITTELQYTERVIGSIVVQSTNTNDLQVSRKVGNL